MSEIPDEVMGIAADLAWEIVDLCEGCGCDECFEKVKQTIARALMAARAEERGACAKIAAGNSAEFDFANALAECRDSEHGFHSGRLHAASAIRDRR